MAAVNRPLSPHIGIYRKQLTSVLSITHRATGITLVAGLVLLAYWLMALAGGPEALDVRSAPYPMPPMPLSYNLVQLKAWAEKSGIPFWTNPVAKTTVEYRGRSACRRCDTCNICPTGAKYTPDLTWARLIEDGQKLELPGE